MNPCGIEGPLVQPSSIHAGTKLVVFGEMGGAEEARTGRGFWGVSGRELRKALRQGGFHVDSGWPNDKRIPPKQEDVAFTNTVIHRHNNANVFPGAELARKCLSRCQQSLVGNDSHPWLACGANAVESLTGFRFPKFLDIRGSFLPFDGRSDQWLVATVHPAFIVRGGSAEGADDGKAQSALFPFLALDAKRAVDGSNLEDPDMPFLPNSVHYTKATWLGDPEETLSEYEQVFKGERGHLVAIDIEGGYNSPITLVGLSWRSGEASVLPWCHATQMILKALMPHCLPVFHNAAYDVPALEAEGVEVRQWIDTINLAALVNPSVKLGLEAQALTYVPGSVTWKGLIDHRQGIHAQTPTVKLYRKLWTEVLSRGHRLAPEDDESWFRFYNALDVSTTFIIAEKLKRELEAQGRLGYYRNVMQPLQAPLLRMGLKGMPVDLDRMGHHKLACERLERMAQGILDRAAGAMLRSQYESLQEAIVQLESERNAERARGVRAFSRAKELTATRTKLRGATEAEGFSGDSAPQRMALLYDWLGLPEVRHRKTGNRTSDESAVSGLVLRLQKGTIRPKRGTSEEASKICKALMAISKWSDWRRAFLTRKDA